MNGSAWETLCRHARRQDGPALLGLDGRRPLAWPALPAVIAGLAETLVAAGAGPASRIALALPPGAEMVTLFLAAIRAGIAVPLNPELTTAETAEALARLRPHLLVARPGLPGRPEAAAAALGIPTLLLEWDGRDPVGAPRVVATSPPSPPLDADPLAAPPGTSVVLQTSGTTALPKLVPLTAANLEHSAAALIASLELTAADRAFNLLPQFHIGGLWDLVAAPLLSGGSVICGGVFSRAAFVAGCAFAPSWVQLVPSMLHAILDAGEAVPSSLRFVRSVSAALPPALKAEAEARLGVPVVEIYGMTETAGVITSGPLDLARQRSGSVGLVVGPGVTIRGRAGEVLRYGAEGEVVVRGPQVSPGYIAAAAEDAAAFGPDGFRTGDLGRFEEGGHLRLVGRVKDLVNRGGEMIGPAEIEAVLLAAPGVRDAAVFGVPHATLGEEIEAAVVLEAPEDAGPATARLRSHLRARLGHGRMPARIHVVEALPRTPGGKLRRRMLTERFAGSADHDPVPAPRHRTWPLPPLSRWVAEIWAPILGLSAMGADDDFFLEGGTSLQAAQAAAVIQGRFPDQILYVSSVYEAPTPRLQAAFLDAHYPAVAAAVRGLHLRPEAPPPPVTPDISRTFDAALADPLPHPPHGRAMPGRRVVLILGAPRSGSTLLRAMLAGHPDLFAPPELYLLSHPDLAARRAWYGAAHASQLEGLPRALMGASGISAPAATAEIARLEAVPTAMPQIYARLQSAIGDRILVDKTPFYGVHRHVLAAAETVFDEVFFIHLSRHPYGMIRSFEEAKLAQLWWPRLAGPTAKTCPFHPRQLAELLWARIHGTVIAFLAGRPPGGQLHLRYEDLVADPQSTSRRIAAALGIDAHPAMLDPLSEPSARMTDGLHPGSRMIGDPKFHDHRGIERAAADQWKAHYEGDFLSEATWAIAAALGHRERVADASTRVIFEI